MNSIKFLLLGMAVGSLAAIAIASNYKLTEKIKDVTQNTNENLNSMFKIK